MKMCLFGVLGDGFLGMLYARPHAHFQVLMCRTRYRCIALLSLRLRLLTGRGPQPSAGAIPGFAAPGGGHPERGIMWRFVLCTAERAPRPDRVVRPERHSCRGIGVAFTADHDAAHCGQSVPSVRVFFYRTGPFGFGMRVVVLSIRRPSAPCTRMTADTRVV